MSRYLLAIAAMPAILAGCGTAGDSPAPPAATAAPASQSPYVGQSVPGLTPERFAPPSQPWVSYRASLSARTLRSRLRGFDGDAGDEYDPRITRIARIQEAV